MRHFATVLLCASLLAGCAAHDAPAPAAATAGSSAASVAQPVADAGGATGHHAEPGGIQWFDGDVDAAFAAAREQHKPVFLYWGAVWCPPCHQLKSSVFNRPDFIAKTRLFVPVYLDGDEAGAQKWGDTFRVTGYPTLVVLDDNRNEIMRIAGGMDLSQYANVLDLALADLQPASVLLASAAQGHPLKDVECRRLAYTAWGLEDIDANASGAQSRKLQAAAKQCPATLTHERARLVAIAATFAADAEKTALKQGAQPGKALQALVAEVYASLADPAAASADADAYFYPGESFFQAARALKSPTPEQYYQRFAAVMDAAARRPEFTEADHLAAIGNRLQAARILLGQIDPALAKDARAAVDIALAGQQIPYVRSGIINAVLPIFDLLGQNEEAYRVVQGELGKTQTPYYYKADLADLAETLGRKSEALDWARQAYAESQGVATRFQWGRLYLGALLRLSPADTATIRQVGGQVLNELDGTDRIYRRARTRLASLDGELRKWAAGASDARTPVLRALRAQLQGTCAKIPAADAARASCDAFLKGVG